MSGHDAGPLVVSKTRRTLDGRRAESHYACGPVRATVEEATEDAIVFAKLPGLMEGLANIADPDSDRWRGETVLRMLRRLLGIDPSAQGEGTDANDRP